MLTHLPPVARFDPRAPINPLVVGVGSPAMVSQNRPLANA